MSPSRPHVNESAQKFIANCSAHTCIRIANALPGAFHHPNHLADSSQAPPLQLQSDAKHAKLRALPVRSQRPQYVRLDSHKCDSQTMQATSARLAQHVKTNQAPPSRRTIARSHQPLQTQSSSQPLLQTNTNPCQLRQHPQ